MEENEQVEIPSEPQEIDLNDLSGRKIGEKVEKEKLDGKTVKIVDIKLVPTEGLKKTKDGLKEYRAVLFKVFYDNLETYENYGGVMQFKHGENYAEPTIWAEGKSAAAKLLQLWVNFKGADIKNVSFKDFFKGIIGLTGVIETKTVSYQGEDFVKNVIKELKE